MERDLLDLNGMKVLEARFYPRKRGGGPAVVVGRLLCDGARVDIEPATSEESVAGSLDVATALVKLRFLVGKCLPAPFEKLQQLRSEFWSFVEIAS